MNVKTQAWENFFENACDFESDTSNFKVPFKVLTKKFGQAYMVFCKEMWKANEGVMTEEEFRVMNGDMPEGFFNNAIKGR
jgi:hypothetical protein